MQFHVLKLAERLFLGSVLLSWPSLIHKPAGEAVAWKVFAVSIPVTDKRTKPALLLREP
jgi:hypothetical protein